MPTVSVTVTLDDGRKFEGRIFQITGTHLGRDLDHMSFVAHLELSGGDRETMLAPLLTGLDQFDAKVQKHITAILETVGVAFWEELIGKYVIALMGNDGFIKGITSLDGTRGFLVEETFAEPRSSVA